MKSLLAVLIAVFASWQALSEANQTTDNEIILPASPLQKVFTRYQRDFGFHHDRGFYFSAALGPQWNHSIEKPNAKGIRFGGKLNAGWFVANGVALFASGWGNFLEAASLVAAGPGVAFLFDSTNIGVDFSLGAGRIFNGLERSDIQDFSEWVLAGNLAVGKFWWLSGKTSLGVSLSSGIHGLTLSKGTLNSVGWNVGFNMAFLIG